MGPCPSSPALPVVRVALRGAHRACRAHAGAVAGLAARPGVEAKGVGVADLALGPGRARRAEASPSCLLAGAPAAAACCRDREKRAGEMLPDPAGLHQWPGF